VILSSIAESLGLNIMLKTVSSIANAIGALNYKGTWDASTNSPALASNVGAKGDYYVVSVAGTTTLNGISIWGVGDWVVFNGSVWQRVEGGTSVDAVDVTFTGTASGPTYKTGSATQRGYQGTGALTVTATFNTTLNGSFWRNAIIEVVFQGMTAGGDAGTLSRYYIPIQGITAWNITTPVKVYGTNLTITQTANANNSVTFTVAGPFANEVGSMFVLATANNGVSLS
jgi:hypothetical protein